MNTIPITPDIPYAPSGIALKELRVTGLGFAAYARAAKAAGGAKTDAEARRRSTRERLKMQVRAIAIDDSEHKLTDEDISMMPIPYALKLRDAATLALFPSDAGEAKVLVDGNGMNRAIHIMLGTPIKGGGGMVISELEFQAKTVAELEDVLSMDGVFEQTEALFGIARPVEGSLSALPSWATEQISIADGLFIMNKVRPAFFDQPTSS